MPSSPPCNENRLNCTPSEVLAATMIPSCGELVNPANLQAEQLVFDQAFNDLINNFGIPVDYYINTFNLSAADLLYGTDFGSSTTSQFQGPLTGVQMYIELSDDALALTKFGFDPGDEFTAFVHISTFATAASAYFDYASVGQSIEPKAGDVIDLKVLGCDRPNGRGSVKYEITERMDQDLSVLNPVLGHYIYRLRGKRFNYSFESGLSGAKTASAVDAIDVDGYIAGGGDNQFSFTIPVSAGGSGTQISIFLDISAGGSLTAGTNQIAISAANETDAAVAANITKAINGITSSRITYGNSSGDGYAGVGVKGINASQGSSDTQITLQMDKAGVTGNATNVIALSTGAVNLVDVTSFTGGQSVDPVSEPVNEQIYDNSFSGILSTTLASQLTSDGKTYPTVEDPYDIDDSSQNDVFNMDVNDTDIYGSYY